MHLALINDQTGAILHEQDERDNFLITVRARMATKLGFLTTRKKALVAFDAAFRELVSEYKTEVSPRI